MNPRILIAFAAGALAAAGVVLIAMRPMSRLAPTAVSAATSVQPAADAPVRVIPAMLPDVNSADELVRVERHDAPATLPAGSRKPSAMPSAGANRKWPADHAEPAELARSLPPAIPNDPGQPAIEQPDSMPVKRTIEPPPQIVNQPPQPVPAPLAAEQPRVPHVVVLRSGTLICVRLGQSLTTARTQVGDPFLATLDQPLVIDGWIIAARGSRAEGRVVVSGRSQLGLQLTAINTTDRQHLGIGTATFVKRGPSWGNSDTAAVGGAAAFGAVIGAMADGGKGAGIGAVVGGAAGAGGMFAMERRNADVPVETRITFRVDQPLTITERLN